MIMGQVSEVFETCSMRGVFHAEWTEICRMGSDEKYGDSKNGLIDFARRVSVMREIFGFET